MLPTDALADAIADRIIIRLREELGAARAPDRVLLADVATHGAPSARWVTDRARSGAIEIKGPRGARYVDAGALGALLERTSIRRAARMPSPAESGVSLATVAKSAVSEIAARRAGGTQ